MAGTLTSRISHTQPCQHARRLALRRQQVDGGKGQGRSGCNNKYQTIYAFPRLQWQRHVADARSLQESTRLQAPRCKRGHPADLCQGSARLQGLARVLRTRCWLLHPSGAAALREKSTWVLFAYLVLPWQAAASIRLPRGLPGPAGDLHLTAPLRQAGGRLLTRVEGTAAFQAADAARLLCFLPSKADCACPRRFRLTARFTQLHL